MPGRLYKGLPPELGATSILFWWLPRPLVFACGGPFPWRLLVVMVAVRLFAFAFSWLLSFALAVVVASSLAHCLWWWSP